jgi:hypothetical protein
VPVDTPRPGNSRCRTPAAGARLIGACRAAGIALKTGVIKPL